MMSKWAMPLEMFRSEFQAALQRCGQGRDGCGGERLSEIRAQVDEIRDGDVFVSVEVSIRVCGVSLVEIAGELDEVGDGNAAIKIQIAFDDVLHSTDVHARANNAREAALVTDDRRR